MKVRILIPKSFREQPNNIKDYFAMIRRNKSYPAFKTVSADISITKFVPSIGQFIDGQRVYYIVDANKRQSYFGLYRQALNFAGSSTAEAFKRQGSQKVVSEFIPQLKAI